MRRLVRAVKTDYGSSTRSRSCLRWLDFAYVRTYARRHVHVVQFVCIYHIGSNFHAGAFHTYARTPSKFLGCGTRREYAIERDTTIDDACAPTVRHRPIDDDPIRRRRLCVDSLVPHAEPYHNPATGMDWTSGADDDDQQHSRYARSPAAVYQPGSR